MIGFTLKIITNTKKTVMNAQQQIENFILEYYNVFQLENWNKFETYLTDDFEYFTDLCSIQNKRDFINFLSKNEWKVSSYKISDLHVIASEKQDLIIAIYKIEFKGVSNNQNVTLTATETTVLTETKAGWKVAHCHSSNK